MKKIIVIILVFLIPNLLAENFDWEGDIQFTKPYLFVSLGCNCWQAQALRHKTHSLRDAAFPFDWLLTHDTDLLIKCLDEKFKYFCDESCFKRCTGSKTNLENTRYNFIFTHDWPSYANSNNANSLQVQLDFMRKKYTRRIARFDNLRNFSGKVFFMRCFQINPHYEHEWGCNAQKARNLNDALKRFFPELNFTLIIVSCTDQTVY